MYVFFGEMFIQVFCPFEFCEVFICFGNKTFLITSFSNIFFSVVKRLAFLTCLLLFPVLLKFRTDKGRDPSSDTFGEDSELLLQIRNDVLDALGVDPDLLPEDFVRLV